MRGLSTKMTSVFCIRGEKMKIIRIEHFLDEKNNGIYLAFAQVKLKM